MAPLKYAYNKSLVWDLRFATAPQLQRYASGELIEYLA